MLDKGQSLFSALGIESRASRILGKLSTTELYPRLKANLFRKDIFIKSLYDRKLERVRPEAVATSTLQEAGYLGLDSSSSVCQLCG